MTRRTYGQFCAVAKALDIVGERWTLLLVRELMLGPRRFTDLQTVLPGLGTNLLSARLKQLEDAGAVRRDRLPPPAASTVYRLTELGSGLAPVVKALAGWGNHLLDEPAADEAFRPEWLALYLAASAPAIPGVRETYQLDVDGQLLHIRVADGRAWAQLGPSPYPPDLVLTTDTATFAELGLGELDLATAVRTDRVRADAAADVLERAGRVLTRVARAARVAQAADDPTAPAHH
jgi:DNA-binding HxlR family transcriptional regulator